MAENSGTTLAKAYVQIVPSAEGIKDSLGRTLSAAGGDSGGKFGASFAKTAISSISAAAIGKAIAKTVTEGAALEQSLGGVETMFKESADKVTASARRAFQTAGVSANEYMEQVTSFSATLLQGLGGDTEKAADYADKAIVDMSDNANKFGTDISLIQNAYQGFAKQNYTMLDNLKLGYGGTQAEMARLINDSGVLGDTITVTAETVNEVSFDKMIEAIHTVQGDLGVTGTTAEEAATTFTGSFNAMKASAENLLASLSTGAYDIDESVKDLAETAETFVVDNLLPMLGNIREGLRTIDGGLGTAAAAALGLGEALLGLKLANGLIASIDAVSAKLGAAANLGEKFSKALGGKANIALAAAAVGGELLASVIDKATDAIEEAPPKYSDLTDAQRELAESTDTLISTLGSRREEREGELGSLDEEAERHKTLIDRLRELNSQQSLDAQSKAEIKAIVDELNESFDGLNLTIDENTGKVKGGTEALKRQVEQMEISKKAQKYEEQLNDIYLDRKEAIAKEAEALKAYNEIKSKRSDLEKELAELQSKNPDDMRNDDWNRIQEIKTELETVGHEVGDMAANYSNAAEAVNALNDEYANMEAFYADLSASDTNITDLCYKAVELKQSYQDAGTAITELASGYRQEMQTVTDELYGSLNLFDAFPEQLEITSGQMTQNLDSNLQAVENWKSQMELLTANSNISDGLIDELRDMGFEALPYMQALNSMTDEELKDYSDKWESAYGKTGEAAEAGLIRTREKTNAQIAELQKEGKEYRKELEDTYVEIGEQISAGVAKGIIDDEGEALEAARQLIRDVEKSMRDEAEIASPAKRFRRLAVYIPEGTALGITDGGEEVNKAARGLISGVENSLAGADTRLPIAEYDISPVYRAARAQSQAGYSAPVQPNLSGESKQAVFNLVVNGQTFARAVAADLDSLNGADILLKERGVAT